MIVFGFSAENFGRWQGPTKDTLSFYECRLRDGDTGGSGDTQTVPTIIKFV